MERRDKDNIASDSERDQHDDSSNKKEKKSKRNSPKPMPPFAITKRICDNVLGKSNMKIDNNAVELINRIMVQTTQKLYLQCDAVRRCTGVKTLIVKHIKAVGDITATIIDKTDPESIMEMMEEIRDKNKQKARIASKEPKKSIKDKVRDAIENKSSSEDEEEPEVHSDKKSKDRSSENKKKRSRKDIEDGDVKKKTNKKRSKTNKKEQSSSEIDDSSE
jgi:hypothetical protein